MALPGLQIGFRQVEMKYQNLRRQVFEFTIKNFSSSNFLLREITYNDAMSADRWRMAWSEQHKRPTWSWVEMYNRSRNLLKRFDIALIVNGEPVALCYGLPSKKKVLLKLHTLARRPNANPLAGHVLDVVLFAASAYASLLGCEEIWLVAPMNDILVEKYQAFGYTAQRNKTGKVTHLSIKVNYKP